MNWQTFSKTLLSASMVLLVLWGCGTSTSYERPREPWAFRSVLDEKPRVLTLALNKELYVAYDTQHGGIFKAWNGDVNFDGAVYTTAHGPQPTSKGFGYMEDNRTASVWHLSKEAETKPAKVQYLGHRFDKGQVTLTFKLSNDLGEVVLEEQPEFISKGGRKGLSQHFLIKENNAGLRPVREVLYNSLISENAIEMDNASIDDQTLESNDFDWGKTYLLKGKLTLPASGKASIAAFFRVMEVKEVGEDPLSALQNSGMALISGSDCNTCHNTYKYTVGPSYYEIAEKYKKTEENIDYLAKKIINGGTGVWGEVPMSAHPDLTEEDATTMVEYILSLYQEDKQPKKKQGMLVMFYQTAEPFIRFAELRPGQSPNAYKVFPVLDLREGDFEGFTQNFVAIGRAELVIDQKTKYAFRLINNGGAKLMINGKEILRNGFNTQAKVMDTEIELDAGTHEVRIEYLQAGKGNRLALQWAPFGSNEFKNIPSEKMLAYGGNLWTWSGEKAVMPYKRIPGDGEKLEAVHPSFDLLEIRPEGFTPKVGGIDFLADGRMVVTSWDSVGAVWLVDKYQDGDPSTTQVKRIATGLAEPLGVSVYEGEIYVLQKQELTKLIDHNGDDIIDEYRAICNAWEVTSNFHEFAFGLVQKDGYFYATLATAILPGGASVTPQNKDRGTVIKIHPSDGSYERVADGLRTPNGIGIGVDGEIFVADNQGDWLPASKIVHVKQGAFYGARATDPIANKDRPETLPVAWLTQDEIGNSPSQPLYINVGPYKGQMLHGEVTHGGLKRVFAEKVNGQYQSALFRFTQGLEAGVNRVAWGPDGVLYIGGIGNPGNWGHEGKLWYGLQGMKFNGKTTFEMLAVRAKTDGVEIEFTEPLAVGQGMYKDEYTVKQWFFKPTEAYGGPKMNLHDMKIKSVNLSEDRKRVFLELDGMKPNHMVYIRIAKPFVSESRQDLWTTECWYTMNEIPADSPGFRTTAMERKHNVLTDAEKAAGWELLFDGKTTNGWRNFKKETIGKKWKVQDGMLVFEGKLPNEAGWQASDGGDIITDRVFENYEFTIEWKISEGGNSGIIYNVIESDEYDYVWQTGPEMQILDNDAHDDAKIHMHRSGDLYDLIPCKVETVNPAGEWNQVRIYVNNGKLEHWQNGYKVVETEMWTEEWKKLIAGSKFAEMPGFGTARKGHIALQDHGDKVWFRNIKIREIK